MLVELVLDPEIFPLPLPTPAPSCGESVGDITVSVPWLRLLSPRTARAVTSSSFPKHASRFVQAHVHLFPMESY